MWSRKSSRFYQLPTVCLVTLVVLGLMLISSVSLISAWTAKTAVGQRRIAARPTISFSHEGRSWINLRDGFEVPTTYAGAAGLERMFKQNLVKPLALASADFDEDGVPDLVCGYAGPSSGVITLHRGNVYSIYPNTPEQQPNESTDPSKGSPLTHRLRSIRKLARLTYLSRRVFLAQAILITTAIGM